MKTISICFLRDGISLVSVSMWGRGGFVGFFFDLPREVRISAISRNSMAENATRIKVV